MMGTLNSLPSGPANAAEINWLPALLGIAAALGFWLGGEVIQDRVKQLQQGLDDARQTSLPRTALTLPAAERSAADLRRQRVAIESMLQSTDPVSYVQAKVVYELRQSCAAEGIQACAVRYFDESTRGDQRPAASAARSPAVKASAASVADLGLGRARAIISGSFQDLEFRRFINKLRTRPEAGLWRINALTVRNNTFEIDAELIVRPAPASEAKTP